jgi:hypothetical protein
MTDSSIRPEHRLAYRQLNDIGQEIGKLEKSKDDSKYLMSPEVQNKIKEIFDNLKALKGTVDSFQNDQELTNQYCSLMNRVEQLEFKGNPITSESKAKETETAKKQILHPPHTAYLNHANL